LPTWSPCSSMSDESKSSTISLGRRLWAFRKVSTNTDCMRSSSPRPMDLFSKRDSVAGLASCFPGLAAQSWNSPPCEAVLRGDYVGFANCRAACGGRCRLHSRRRWQRCVGRRAEAGGARPAAGCAIRARARPACWPDSGATRPGEAAAIRRRRKCVRRRIRRQLRGDRSVQN
jgi:hypothetical protein